MTSHPPDWRRNFNVGSELRERVTNRIIDRLAASPAEGLAEYGPDFAGDPLEHAWGESFDQLVYLGVEIEKRAMLRRLVGTVVGIIGDVLLPEPEVRRYLAIAERAVHAGEPEAATAAAVAEAGRSQPCADAVTLAIQYAYALGGAPAEGAS